MRRRRPPLPRGLTAQQKARRRRALRTRWPGVYEVIGSDGRQRYRVVAPNGPCSCQAGRHVTSCWHVLTVPGRRHVAETETETEPAAPPAADGEQKQKRTRRTRAQIEADERADLPPFDPSIVQGRITATGERTVRTGQYESYTARIHMDFERDPRFGVQDCAGMLADACRAEVNKVCDRVQAEIQVEK